jgi:hypothetical protein
MTFLRERRAAIAVALVVLLVALLLIYGTDRIGWTLRRGVMPAPTIAPVPGLYVPPLPSRRP